MPDPLHLITVVDRYPCLSETFIDREIQEMRRQGAVVDVFALRGPSPCGPPPGRPAWSLFPRILRDHGSDLRRCLWLLRHSGHAAALADRIRNLPRAHLLAQFAWTPAEVARMASRLSGVPFSVRTHAWDVFTPSARALRRRLEAAASVLPCNASAADTIRQCGIPPERITLVHHGLPLHDPDWRLREDTPPSVRILGIGRLVAKKGVGVLLDACALLARDEVRFTLEWIGDGPERTQLLRYARSMGLQGQVRFRGALPPGETRAVLREAALLVLPSVRLAGGDRDGIANVLVEAMALGVPVVTTTAAGALEILTHDVNGLLVPPRDPAALAEAMRQGLVSAPLRQRLARAARTTVEHEFDLERNTGTLLRAIARATD